MRLFFKALNENHQDAIMSRQDANAAFALSSFLQGTNASYIDDIYARYEKDPASVDPEWQEFFQSLTQTKATGDLLSQTIPAVPEPQTYALLLAGLGVVGFVARRRRQY